MRCVQVEPLVERYVDGGLEPPLASAVEEHARSCRRCAVRIDAARRLVAALETEPAIAAPHGFLDAVMDRVYAEALAPRPAPVQGEASRSGGRLALGGMYRRLGLSFMLTAAVLATSLLVPRASYATLLGGQGQESGFGQGSAATVRAALQGADQAVRGILGERMNGGERR
jgi:anti-sigma factor RsiW